MNQLCKVCGEPAAGFHFGAFTCEGCKSFFGRTYNNLSSISECKNNGECIINKKNRTTCKACRLRKCLLVGMSKSGSRYGRRSNWFKIHCLLQEQQQAALQSQFSVHSGGGTAISPSIGSETGGSAFEIQKPLATPQPDLAGFFAQTFASSLRSGNPFLSPFYHHLATNPASVAAVHNYNLHNFQNDLNTPSTKDSAASESAEENVSSTEEDEDFEKKSTSRLKMTDKLFLNKEMTERFHPLNSDLSKTNKELNKINNNNNNDSQNNNKNSRIIEDKNLNKSVLTNSSVSPSSDPGYIFSDKKQSDSQFSPPPKRVTVSSMSWPANSAFFFPPRTEDSTAWKDIWLRSFPLMGGVRVPSDISTVTDINKNDDSGESNNADSDGIHEEDEDQPIDLSIKSAKNLIGKQEPCSKCDEDGIILSNYKVEVENNNVIDENNSFKTVPLDLTKDTTNNNNNSITTVTIPGTQVVSS